MVTVADVLHGVVVVMVPFRFALPCESVLVDDVLVPPPE
jgi:hypothetical protein